MKKVFLGFFVMLVFFSFAAAASSDANIGFVVSTHKQEVSNYTPSGCFLGYYWSYIILLVIILLVIYFVFYKSKIFNKKKSAKKRVIKRKKTSRKIKRVR